MPVADTQYAIECACGTVARGTRTGQNQTLTCVNCRGHVFIFPASPLPPDLLGSAADLAPPVAGSFRLPAKASFWLVPAVAAIVALAIVGVVIASIVRNYRPAANGVRQLTESQAAEQAGARYEAAKGALADGAYRLAFRELDAALALPAGAVAPELLKQLKSWHTQVGLLADLSPESIEEIMRHSIGQTDREWQAVFRERYAGRSVVLDARVFRDAGGQYRIDYQLAAGGLHGEWDIQNFALFSRLPLQRPQRIVFGFRLAEIARSGRDRWTVRPEPGSGVLLTDETLLAGLSIPVDTELRAVLRRQAGWELDN